MEPSMYTITLVLGDWSGDGHSMTETFVVESSLNKEQLVAAFYKGCGIASITHDADCKQHWSTSAYLEMCGDYEDNSLSGADYKKLEKHGCIPHCMITNKAMYLYKGKWSLDTEVYSQIWMLLAKLGEPSLEYKFIQDNKPTINIGGYGLFS